MKRCKLGKNNKGSALIMVIIAMAFVGILAAIIMYMSMLNYMMKAADRKTRDNFYSSETVLDQMLAGLQADSSNAIHDAYLQVMQNYSSYTAKQRQDLFADLYIDKLRNRLKDGGDVSKYNVAILKNYVDPVLFAAPYEIKVETKAPATTFSMETYADHLLLRNMQVTFIDSTTGTTSIISTDFCLDVPAMNFTQSSEMPELFDYSLVANESLIGVPGITAEIEGNIYGGKYGINLQRADEITMKNADFIVTNTTISLNGVGTAGNAAKLTITGSEKPPMVWAENIDVRGGQLSVSGQTFVADDLTITGSGGSVKLSKEYYGYGTSLNQAGQSSAIVINSKESELDISKLDRILIGGHGYIGTKTAAGVETNLSASGNKLVTQAESDANQDIRMGESIAVKGSQIAYLVPPQLIGVDTVSGDNTVLIGKNPMKSADYTRLQQYKVDRPDSFHEVATNMYASQLGNTLSHYGVTDSHIKTVFAPSRGETLVYYYLELDEANASQYFKDYYGIAANKEKMDQYYNFYVKGIKADLGNYARINTQGNWLVGDKTTGVSLNAATPADPGALAVESTDYSDRFAALKCKLVTNRTMLSSEEKLKDVFANLVLRDKLLTYTAGGTKTFTDAGSSLKAILSGTDLTYNGDTNVRLIVTTGNVTVNDDFSGLIVAGGTITLNHNAKITPNKADLTKVLQYKDSTDDTIKPITFFTNGSTYVLDGTSVSANDTEEEDKVRMKNIVRYQNWTKQ